MDVLTSVLTILGYILSAIGLLVAGIALGQFTLAAYEKAGWQVQIALIVGLFGLLVGLADFVSPGSVGAFALGTGIAYFMASAGKKKDQEDKE